MKLKVLFALLLSMASTAFAAESWRGIAGEYYISAPEGNRNSGAIVNVYQSGITLSAYGSAWSTDATTHQLVFSCSDQRCDLTNSGWRSTNLLVKSNGTLILQCDGAATFTLVRIGNSGSDSQGSNPWSFKEYADANQMTYSAYQVDNSTGANLVVSCKAKSNQLNWAIRLSEKSYLAAQGAVLYAKSTLKGTGKIDSLQPESSVWETADNRYIVNKLGTPLNIENLKRGSSLNLTLVAMKPDGSEVTLESMKFSLKGSTAALNKLQSSCLQSNDLPVPLP